MSAFLARPTTPRASSETKTLQRRFDWPAIPPDDSARLLRNQDPARLLAGAETKTLAETLAKNLTLTKSQTKNLTSTPALPERGGLVWVSSPLPCAEKGPRPSQGGSSANSSTGGRRKLPDCKLTG